MASRRAAVALSTLKPRFLPRLNGSHPNLHRHRPNSRPVSGSIAQPRSRKKRSKTPASSDAGGDAPYPGRQPSALTHSRTAANGDSGPSALKPCPSATSATPVSWAPRGPAASSRASAASTSPAPSTPLARQWVASSTSYFGRASGMACILPETRRAATWALGTVVAAHRHPLSSRHPHPHSHRPARLEVRKRHSTRQRLTASNAHAQAVRGDGTTSAVARVSWRRELSGARLPPTP